MPGLRWMSIRSSRGRNRVRNRPTLHRFGTFGTRNRTRTTHCDEHVTLAELTLRLLQANRSHRYPFTTPIGRIRATFFDSPALCTVSTTRSPFL